MMKLQWVVVLVAALAGFGVGRLSSGGGGEELSQQPLGSVENALEKALALPFGVERTGRYVTILGGLDDERAGIIASVLERDLSRLSQSEVRLFAGAWAELAPEAALNRMLAWNLPVPRTAGSRQVMEVWARDNPVGARLALDELEDKIDDIDGVRGPLSIGLVYGWVESGIDPEGLGPYVSQLKDWDRERTTRELVDRLIAAQGDEAAMAWANAVPRDAPQSFRNVAFRKIALVIGAKDPEFVARWLDPHREYRYGQAGFRVLGRTWMTKDPQAAMAWVADQPDDRARELFINFGFDRWYEDAPEAALEWLSSMSGDGLADPARTVAALAARPRDPALAARTALDIRDPDQRLDIFGKVLGPWSKRAPKEMGHWLEEANLSGPEQALAERAMASIGLLTSTPRSKGASARSVQGAAEPVP